MSGSRLDQLAIKRKNFLDDISDHDRRIGRLERYPNPATTSSAAPGTPAEGLTLDDTIDANLLDLALNVLSLDTQASGKVFAGPESGANAAPSFRDLIDNDIPTTLVRTAYWAQNGFENRTDSSLTWSDSSPDRTLSIQPTGDNFEYWVDGTRYVSTGDTVQITDTEGVHVIYYDDDTLTAVANPTTAQIDTIIRTKASVSIVYWDTSEGAAIYVGEERHGKGMAPDTHAYLHFTEGTRYLSGLGLSSMSVDQSGDDNAHAQFGVDSGAVTDEDIYYAIGAVASATGLPIYYMLGADAEWQKHIEAGFSVRTFDGTSSTRLAYNQYTGGAWQLTEVGNNSFVLCHVFATTEKDSPMLAIMGQDEYGTKAAARSGATTEIYSLILDDILFPEIKPIATVIFQTGDSYGNDVQARVVSTDDGDDYIDWRSEVISRVAFSTTDHNALTNVTSNQHHDAVTLSGDLESNLLGISAQVLSLDTQASGTFFAGPVSGANAAPTFRAIAAGDLPDSFAGFGVPALTLTTANAEGSAATAIRTDASIAIFDATVPTTIQPSASAAVGSAAFAARRDHTHGAVAATPIDIGTSNLPGITLTFVRSDHQHKHPSGLGTDLHHSEVHTVSSTGPHAETGLTAGHVLRASAATAFSFAALQASDLPAHTHVGAGTGGALAVGTTVLTGTQGSIPFIGAGSVITQDNAGLYYDATNGRLGVGATPPSYVIQAYHATNNNVLAGVSGDDLATFALADDDTGTYYNAKDGFASIGGTAGLAATNLNVEISTGYVALGATSPGNSHLYVEDTALTSTSTFYGAYFSHTKTAGVGAAADDYYGIYTMMDFDQSTAVDNIDAVFGEAKITTGTCDVTRGANVRSTIDGGTVNIRSEGVTAIVDVNGGSLNDCQGARIVVGVDAAATISGDITGIFAQVSDSAGASGTVTGVHARVSDAATTTVTDIVTIEHLYTGATGVGADFGAGLLWKLEDAGGTSRDAARMAVVWQSAAAAEVAEFQLLLNYSGTLRDCGVVVAPGFAPGAGNQRGVGAVDWQPGRVAATDVASGDYATISGGGGNTASGYGSTVPGGADNTASGDYTFVAGRYGTASHDDSFVWSSAEATASWAANTFTARCHGGARFYAASGTATGVEVVASTGDFVPLAAKTHDLGSSSAEWDNIFYVTANTGTSRLIDSHRDCPVCGEQMKRGTGTMCIMGEDADYAIVFCVQCGAVAVEPWNHHDDGYRAERRPPPEIVVTDIRVKGAGRHREVAVDFKFGSVTNSTRLSDGEIATLTSAPDDEKQRLLHDIGLREWESREENRIMQGACKVLQDEIKLSTGHLIGKNIAMQN